MTFDTVWLRHHGKGTRSVCKVVCMMRKLQQFSIAAAAARVSIEMPTAVKQTTGTHAMVVDDCRFLNPLLHPAYWALVVLKNTILWSEVALPFNLFTRR
jgi:hypothetical protein